VLADHGADLDAQDHDGWTPLMHAAFRGRAAVVRLLLVRLLLG
jgi:ankyrin repeat protein